MTLTKLITQATIANAFLEHTARGMVSSNNAMQVAFAGTANMPEGNQVSSASSRSCGAMALISRSVTSCEFP